MSSKTSARPAAASLHWKTFSIRTRAARMFGFEVPEKYGYDIDGNDLS